MLFNKNVLFGAWMLKFLVILKNVLKKILTVKLWAKYSGCLSVNLLMSALYYSFSSIYGMLCEYFSVEI